MRTFSCISLVVALSTLFPVRPAIAQSNPMFLAGHVGLNLPLTGDLKDASSIGFGLAPTFIYEVNPDIDLTGSLGFFSYPGKNNSSFASSSITDIPFLVGVRHYLSRGSMPMYVAGELGLHFESWSVTVPAVQTQFGTFGGGSSSASQTDFGIGGEFGVLSSISPKIDFDGNARLHIITGNGGGLIIGINAGVLYHLN